MASAAALELAGQVALVTGGTRGLGRELASVLVERGAAVAVCGREPERLKTVADELGVLALKADVTSETDMEAAIARVQRELGVPDLLVANAGSLVGIGPVSEVQPLDWWRDVEVSLRGTFLSARAVLPGMLRRGSGRIVAITGGGAFAAIPSLSGYGAAKTAVVRLAETIAREVAGSSMAVFSFSPGPLDTDMGAIVTSSADGKRWLAALAPAYASVSSGDARRAAELIARLASGRYDSLSGCCLLPSDDLDALIAEPNLSPDRLRLKLRSSS